VVTTALPDWIENLQLDNRIGEPRGSRVGHRDGIFVVPPAANVEGVVTFEDGDIAEFAHIAVLPYVDFVTVINGSRIFWARSSESYAPIIHERIFLTGSFARSPISLLDSRSKAALTNGTDARVQRPVGSGYRRRCGPPVRSASYCEGIAMRASSIQTVHAFRSASNPSSE